MIRANEQIRSEVEEVLDRMVAGMQLRNADIFMKVFNTSSGSSSIGIEQNSINIGTMSLQREMEELFKGTESINFKFGWNSIQATEDGAIAWMAANSTMTIKKSGFLPLSIPLRMTFIMERDLEGRLLVTHLHYSTAGNLVYEVDETPVPAAPTTTGEASGKTTAVPVNTNNDDGVFYDIP